MIEQHDDYLWDPHATPHSDIQSLERLLKPLSADALGLADRPLPLPREPARATHWKRYLCVGIAAAATLAGVSLAHLYRLSWPEGAPWPTSIVYEDGSTRSTMLRVGERIATAPFETATLDAARIGKVHIPPSSEVHLTRTRKGQHRLELVQGRLHAKIWAPPSYFGVVHREMKFIDLGCEFDLNVTHAGNGTLAVTSGWVIYEHGNEEILVPERYLLTFDGRSAKVPVRIDSSSDFRSWVNELDAQLTSDTTTDHSRVSDLSQTIAADARNEDYFTLLNLLVRHPQLAQGPLYPRLATTLNIDNLDESHRARWTRGDPSARDEWWQRLPKQPKAWWRYWRDAL